MSNGLKIYTDGGARGNPGPAAAAFVAIADGKIIHKYAEYLGTKTNNEAEYKAVILAFEWLLDQKLDFGSINFILDSELVVRQLSGAYKVKSDHLKNMFFKIKNLENRIDKTINYTSVRREKNRIADRLVNDKLDENKMNFTSPELK